MSNPTDNPPSLHSIHSVSVNGNGAGQKQQPEESEAWKRAMNIIIQGVVRDCYDPDFQAMVAAAGSIEQGRILREFRDKFKTEFRGQDWHRECNDARSKLHLDDGPRHRYADWERNGALMRRMNGDVIMCEANAMLFFEHDPEWRGVLAYNEFTAEHAILLPTPEPINLVPGDFLRDHHDTQFTRWLQLRTGQPWRVDMVRRAVDCCARMNGFHPIRDYLDNLPPWKPGSRERLRTWLFDYAGAGPHDACESVDEALMDFMAAAGERWMISAVARIRNPGCEVHHMLVLEGGEGLGKSMLVKKLGKGWSQVMSGSLDGKSAQELIASAVWIWEFAELASLRKTAEVESAKAFITKSEETFRPAYGHRVIRHKRECAFVATVNNDQYLDSTAWEDGKRRIWPIRCTRPFDLAGLEDVIDLLWAEADYKYRHGHRWHFDCDADTNLIATANGEQAARVPDEPLIAHIERWIRKKEFEYTGADDQFTFDMHDILTDAIGLPVRDQLGTAASNRVGIMLRKIGGFERVHGRPGLDGKRPWVYRRK